MQRNIRTEKKIGIIIPNYQGEKFLKECLDSIINIQYQNFIIVVVDNGSNDSSKKIIGLYPSVILLVNEKNLGFAAACNKGIKYSLEQGAEQILLLNNDTKVAPNFLRKMVKATEDEKTGIVGAKIYYQDKPDKIWFAGGRFISWRASGQHIFWMKNDNDKLQGIRETDFITGCAILIKKEVFTDIGLFFEPYFLTVEDLDFCYLAREKGWKIKVVLDAIVWHKVSFSRQGEFSFSNGYYGTRNRLYFAFKRTNNYFGGLVLIFLILPVRFLQWIITNKKEMLKGAAIGICDFLAGKMGQYNKI